MMTKKQRESYKYNLVLFTLSFWVFLIRSWYLKLVVVARVLACVYTAECAPGSNPSCAL